MTNGEKLVKVFPDIELYKKMHGGIQIDFDSAWWNGEYREPTTKNDLGVDCISRQAVIDRLYDWSNHSMTDAETWHLRQVIGDIKSMPSVTPQEPKTGHCKNCKWWKDSDGAYRRGVGAESQCPINRKEVYEGNGYCYMFEPQESEEE